MRSRLAVMVALLLAACGSSNSGNKTDGGAVTDGGSIGTDGGARVDGGARTDGGARDGGRMPQDYTVNRFRYGGLERNTNLHE